MNNIRIENNREHFNTWPQLVMDSEPTRLDVTAIFKYKSPLSHITTLAPASNFSFGVKITIENLLVGNDISLIANTHLPKNM